jgi:hypothetical protein
MPEAGPPLLRALDAALAAGGQPFEAIAGSPVDRYGARLSFRPAGDPAPLAEEFGLAEHPWGLPAWVGVRVRPDCSLHAKGYHRLPRLDTEAWAEGTFAVAGRRLPLPARLPEGLYPVMGSLEGEEVELYMRLAPARTWSSFADLCTPGAGAASEAPRFAPHPRPVDQAFCLSLRWAAGEELTAVTLYADDRALPDDRDTARLWREGLDELDATAYEAALGGARSLARPRARARHALLAWARERSGTWHRAASLRLSS